MGSKEDSYKFDSGDKEYQSKACLRGHSPQDIEEFDTIQYNSFTDLIPYFHAQLNKLTAIKKALHQNFQLICTGF